MTAPAPFSLIVLGDEDLPAPTSGPYYVATRHGYMIHQNTHWGRTLTPIAEVESLPASDSLLTYDINLPATLIGQAWAFFRTVFATRKSEAMVDITWSKQHGYRLFVPPQQASRGGVNAKRTAEHYRGQIVGTIHSHCDFGAFHSGTDHGDADAQNGLHITIGHVNSDNLDIAIMVSQGNKKWDLKLADITDDPVALQPFPVWWLNQVSDPIPETWKSMPKTPTTKPPQPTWLPSRHPTGPTKPAGIVVSGGSESSFRPPDRTQSWNNIDALLLTLNPNSATVAELEEAQDMLDYVSDSLNELGFDFDYTLTAQVQTGSTPQPKEMTPAALQRILEFMEHMES